MKTMVGIMAVALIFVITVPAIGAETEAGVETESEAEFEILGPVAWSRPEVLSGGDFRIFVARGGVAVCRETVGDRCIPIIPEKGTPGMLVRDGKRFLVLLPRIGDF